MGMIRVVARDRQTIARDPFELPWRDRCYPPDP